MTDFTGHVAAVAIDSIGDELAADATAGATSIVVVDASDFNEAGGSIRLGEQVVAYTEVDDETGILSLAEGLAEDALAGDRVDVWDPETSSVPDQHIAHVSVEGDLADDTVEAVIPTHLVPYLPEGIREGLGEPVVVEERDDTFFVLTLLRPAGFDGSVIDPGSTIPPDAMTDGLPPATSPDCTVLSGLRQVYVKFDSVVNADLVTYEVHVSTDPGFNPTPGDPATMAAETKSTLVSIRALADGTPLNYDDDSADPDPETGLFPAQVYYFRIIARDTDGAAAPGAACPGQMDRTGTGDLVAGSVTTELLDSVLAIVGVLQIGGGLIEASPPGDDGAGHLTGGIVVKDPANPDGEPLVRLHPDGCTFRGQVVTDILTVMQDLIVNGEAHLASGATLLIEGGISDPSQGPTITQGPLTTNWPAVPTGYTQRAICWDPDNSQWLRLLERNSNKLGLVQIVNLDGTAGTLTALEDDGISSIPGWNATGVSGLTKLGAYVYYTLKIAIPAFGNAATYLLRCSLSSGTHYDTAEINGRSAASIPDGAALGTDGTYVYAVAAGNPSPPSLGTGNSTVYASKWGAGLSYVGASTLTGASTTAARAYVGVSDYGYGSAKLSLGYSSAVDVYALPGFGGGSVAKDSALSWSMDATTSSGGLAYKTTGTDQGFYSTHNDSKLSRWSPYYPAASEQFWMKYVDTDGSDHTAPSPVASAAIGKRRFASVTLRPAPGGVTGADLFVGYGSTLPGTFYKRAETISGRVFTLTSGKSTSGSTTVPSTSTMGGTPAEILDETGNSWKGDGSIWLPGAAQPHVAHAADSAQTLTSGASIQVLTTLDTVVDASTKLVNGVDDDIDYDPATGRFYVLTSGIYLVSASILFVGNATGIRSVYIQKNGVSMRNKQSGAVTSSAYAAGTSKQFRCTAGDYITIAGLQNSGGNLQTAASGTEVSITRISA